MLLLVLAGVAAAAVWAFLHYSAQLPKSGTRAVARNLEIIKVSLQVIGVVLVGAVVTLGGASVEAARRDRAASEDRNERDRANTERQEREDFEVRGTLLDRSTRCAQQMFVVCQHVRRRRADSKHLLPYEREQMNGVDSKLLNETYLAFSAEARALENLIRARYGGCEPPLPDRTASNLKWTTPMDSRGHLDEPSPPSAPNWDRKPPNGDHEAFWRWHQIFDLLTVYYFSLLSGQRFDLILKPNALGTDGRFHSGLPLADVKVFAQSDNRARSIQAAIRVEFEAALPDFAVALSTKSRADRIEDQPCTPGDPRTAAPVAPTTSSTGPADG